MQANTKFLRIVSCYKTQRWASSYVQVCLFAFEFLSSNLLRSVVTHALRAFLTWAGRDQSLAVVPDYKAQCETDLRCKSPGPSIFNRPAVTTKLHLCGSSDQGP